MLRTSALLASALLIVGGAASAKTYHIAVTGVCDTLTLKDVQGVISGSSDTAGCDASYEVGTEATVKASILPGGKVLVAAGDLGLSPDQWVWEFNISTGEAELRGTSDGKTVIGGEFGFTFTDGKAPANHGHLPKATEVLKQRAKIIQP
jgi:hypothetical protein